MAEDGHFADNAPMTRPAVFVLPLVLVAAAAGPACDGDGTFDGGVGPDAGPGGGGPVLADIGTPCVYEGDGKNPTNDCPSGLECFIVSRDGAYSTGLALSAWEDQLTIYNADGTDTGYCTLIGDLATPPACPAGSVLKVFSPDVTACLRTCSEAGDCGRVGYTCDVRYLDVIDLQSGQPLKTCVRGCGIDVPDCVRSGIVQNPNDPQQLLPVLAFQDLAGESQCEVDDGVCEFVAQHGTSGPGEPCTATEQCEAGSVCMQGLVLAAVLSPATPLDPNGPGFCASPCTPVADPANEDPQSNCSPSYICQPAGALTLGFPETIVMDITSGALDVRGGFCFHQCAEGVDSTCDAIPGTGCGSFDEEAAADVYIGTPMCLPDALLR